MNQRTKTNPCRSVWRKTLISMAAAAVLGGAAGMVTARVDRVPGPVAAPAVQIPQPGFADLVDAVKPAVVNISVEGRIGARARAAMPDLDGLPPFFRRFFEDFGPHRDPERHRSRKVRAVGSGFLVSAEGHVVTNHHVVEDAEKITVVLNDGKRLEAERVGSDPKTDLAVLKVDADSDLPYLSFGDSGKARAGDWVLAIGNPFGLGGTVTTGILSARGRDIRSGPYDDFLQIDAPINKGNSGGPLFDLQGRVIGVNSAIYSPNGGSVGIGFAIPASQAEPVVEQLIAHGRVERGWLGVRIQTIGEDMADALGLEAPVGALVAQVEPDSPAEAAGLKAGDVILALNGRDITDVRDLTRRVADVPPGQDGRIEIMRNGRSLELTVRIGKADRQLAQADAAEAQPAQGRLGITVASLTDELRERLGLNKDQTGAVVTAVDPDGAAAKKGLEPGDVIARVDDRGIASPRDVVEAVEAAEKSGRERILMLMIRDGNPSFLALRIS